MFFKEPNITNLSAFKNYAHRLTFEVLGSRDPEIQLNITKTHVKNKLKDLLFKMKGFKFQVTSQVTFHKEINKTVKQSIHHQSIQF